MSPQNQAESGKKARPADRFHFMVDLSEPRCAGFSLLEMLIALAILVIVAGIVTSGMVQMMNTQGTINNRTEMHSTVRSATELLQQEIGQAGRITLPPGNQNPTLTAAIPLAAIGTPQQFTATVTPSTAGLYEGEQVVVDAGTTLISGQPYPNQETVTIIPGTLTGNSFSALFTMSHAAGAPIAVLGGFNDGIIPTPNGAGGVGVANGSGPFTLKLFGDINGDGNIVIINYDCNTNAAGTGTLTRSVTPWTAAAQGPTVTLLNNLAQNPPNNAPCFVYQQQNVSINGTPVPFVTNVSVTLTVKTQQKDPVTHQFQQETKALLNVSPRNVFDIWERASQGVYERVQPMPPSVTNLLTQIY